ncbi:MAG: hypothetical protein AAF646_05570 [Pseudomonadota bacterium]
MEIVGKLTEEGGRIVYECPRTGLVVRGDFVEWVLAAAAEMLGDIAKREMDGRIEEMETLAEFGECSPMEVDSARWAHKARFEILPQCSVTMGNIDYRWVAPDAEELRKGEFDGHPVKRVHDMSLTRNDSFLKNEPGVPPSSGETH